MKLRRYCVTVMDNWTCTREFFTLNAANKWRKRHPGYAYLYLWLEGKWWPAF